MQAATSCRGRQARCRPGRIRPATGGRRCLAEQGRAVHELHDTGRSLVLADRQTALRTLQALWEYRAASGLTADHPVISEDGRAAFLRIIVRLVVEHPGPSRSRSRQECATRGPQDARRPESRGRDPGAVRRRRGDGRRRHRRAARRADRAAQQPPPGLRHALLAAASGEDAGAVRLRLPARHVQALDLLPCDLAADRARLFRHWTATTAFEPSARGGHSGARGTVAFGTASADAPMRSPPGIAAIVPATPVSARQCSPRRPELRI